jgi:hypothetical protein
VTTFKSDLVDIACEIVRQTDKAVGVSDGTTDMELDGMPKLFWLPKSQIEINDDGTITMPEWLAMEKGLI